MLKAAALDKKWRVKWRWLFPNSRSGLIGSSSHRKFFLQQKATSILSSLKELAPPIQCISLSFPRFWTCLIHPIHGAQSASFIVEEDAEEKQLLFVSLWLQMTNGWMVKSVTPWWDRWTHRRLPAQRSPRSERFDSRSAKPEKSLRKSQLINQCSIPGPFSWKSIWLYLHLQFYPQVVNWNLGLQVILVSIHFLAQAKNSSCLFQSILESVKYQLNPHSQHSAVVYDFPNGMVVNFIPGKSSPTLGHLSGNGRQSHSTAGGCDPSDPLVASLSCRSDQPPGECIISTGNDQTQCSALGVMLNALLLL